MCATLAAHKPRQWWARASCMSIMHVMTPWFTMPSAQCRSQCEGGLSQELCNGILISCRITLQQIAMIAWQALNAHCAFWNAVLQQSSKVLRGPFGI
mmetsp:Transcript_39090/g.107832  ORF Transcript_39090/g.107832 Transcript_39090/m.107832 type:complete len:97 (-) Transcript_39090:1663-1953(-)